MNTSIFCRAFGDCKAKATGTQWTKQPRYELSLLFYGALHVHKKQTQTRKEDSKVGRSIHFGNRKMQRESHFPASAVFGEVETAILEEKADSASVELLDCIVPYQPDDHCKMIPDT